MFRNLSKSALLFGVAICGYSMGPTHNVIGMEKSNSILSSAGDYVLVQHQGGGSHHGGGGGSHHGGGGGSHHGGGGGTMHGGGGAMQHGGGMMHNGGGAMHNGGGMMHNGGGAMHNGGGIVHNGGSIMQHGGGMHNGGGIVNNGSSSMQNGGGLTHNGGGTMHNGGGLMQNGGGIVHNGGHVLHNRGGVMHNGGTAVQNSAGVIHNGAGIGHNGGSSIHNRGSAVQNGGSANHNGGRVVHNGGSAVHSGGGTIQNGTGMNHAPTINHRTPIGTIHSNGTGIQMSHGRVNLGYHGNNVANSGIHHANAGNHQFTGNNFTLNHHRVSLGSNQYLPSHYQHQRYHGYWNGNYGNNGVSGYRHAGIGRGYGIGPYSGIYSNGYGWGLGYGNGYGYRRHGYGYAGYYPFGWGLGGWGLGSIYYSSGYLGYSNPYYYGVGATCYNYAQPIPVAYNTSVTVVQSAPATVAQNSSNSAEQVMNDAVAAFQQSNFDAALDTVDKGITQYPSDAVLHEFRALVLFAKSDYQQAAATIHSVLAVGPGWDWTTLSSMYSNVALYTDHLRALEAFTKSHPDDAAGHFLLSYHYLSCGHSEAAARHLQTVVTLIPDDKVAADILQMIKAPETPASDSASPPAFPPLPVDGTGNLDTKTLKPEVKQIDPKILIGTWKASRPDGSSFVLAITDDAKFTWSFTQKDQAPQEFGGTYTVESNVLALERKDGGALVGEITVGDSGKFNFRMLGAEDADKGLDFEK